MPVAKGKKAVLISIDVTKLKALKKKAADVDMTLSDLLVKSACDIDPQRLVRPVDLEK